MPDPDEGRMIAVADGIEFWPGDCLDVLASMAPDSVDAVVTDPPYHLSADKRGGSGVASLNLSSPAGRSVIGTGFMGKQWDGGDIAFDPKTWAAVLRVLKPGGHLVAFAAPKNQHRMVCAIEDAGFEIRDCLAWLFGTGFPKSLDVSKAIDRAAGEEREKVRRVRFDGKPTGHEGASFNACDVSLQSGPPITDAARQWEGWGTALKPSYEKLCLAQKPIEKSTRHYQIGCDLVRLESRLWSMLSAKIAGENFGLSQSEFDAACASAQWRADERSNTQGALCAQMDTSRFVMATISSLNTVSSWSAIWAEASERASMSITETELSTTIDLRTLRFFLSRITAESIILAHKTSYAWIANASHAERLFNAFVQSLSAILTRSALAPVLSQVAEDCRGVGAKPLSEPICLARKPLSEPTVAANVLRWGTGALNIDACRVEVGDGPTGYWPRDNGDLRVIDREVYGGKQTGGARSALGRWPANVCHDGSEEVVAGFPNTSSGELKPYREKHENATSFKFDREKTYISAANSGSAARFFYSAKASKADRAGSKHPTVKPVSLMRWLVRMVCPPGGVVLDPFAGTGTTGAAAYHEGMAAILIEREPEYCADIRRRFAASSPQPRAKSPQLSMFELLEASA